MSASERKTIQLPRAKPIILTFYDRIEYPYSSTFYVTYTTPNELIEEFIDSVEALSTCVLGKYKIGYEEYVVSDYLDKLKNIAPHSIGSFKWRIIAYTADNTPASFSIPGRNQELTSRNKSAQIDHPAWQTFLTRFRQLCLTKTGEALQEHVHVKISNGKWPPKGFKQR